MDMTVIESALAAIGSTYGVRAADFSVDQIKSWFSRATHNVGLQDGVSPTILEELSTKILKDGGPVLDAEVTRRNLARWFEIPSEEFLQTPKEQLEPEVLIRHIFLEDTFLHWLQEWGYHVSVGEDLEGRESIDFTPDIYGSLMTLHGAFEVCVNFVCDNPPSQYRVRALLETLEAYATEQSEFKWGDVYILATPFQFGKGASASIRLQSREERYTVVKLEGDDLYELQNARDSQQRLANLMEHVQKARISGPTRER